MSGERFRFKPDRADGKARTELVSCRLTPEAVGILNAIAYRRSMSRAALIRLAISNLLERKP